MIKIFKKVSAVALSAVMATSMAITASAYSSTVAGITVNYSSTINSSSALSTSSISADPTTNSLEAKISATYVYRNTSTGISESDYDYNNYSVGGSGLPYRAPTGCEMKSVAATHYFKINGVEKIFHSSASR